MSIVKPAGLASAATLLLAALQAVAGLLILSPATAPARAAEPVAFTVPADDGYGVEDCMQAGRACGQAIADSFCEAHGHLKAIAFGAAADVTGTIHTGDPAPVAAGDTLIRCGD